ncbi:MAG: PQQ-dependent sugar dehydrogenase, partial [Pirellulales bacterium]
SEIRLFAQRDEASNHNGGDLHFGPDGFLYVALGDEGGGNDSYANGQRIDRDLFAGLLRIDVDQRPGSLPPNRNAANGWMITTNYAIPADNPFVGASTFNGASINPTNVRTEFYAVGLRNPWRFSFDPATGDLWIGDVGQDRWEMVFVSRAGANHGWPFREGRVAGPRTGAPVGFLTEPAFRHVPPVHVYAHGSGNDRGNSITGGRVYRGGRITALHGAYVFADYVNGNVWALRRDAAGTGRSSGSEASPMWRASAWIPPTETSWPSNSMRARWCDWWPRPMPPIEPSPSPSRPRGPFRTSRH